MSNVSEAVSKLKLKNNRNHFSILVLHLPPYRHMKETTGIQAYETTFEITCKTSCAVTSRLQTRRHYLEVDVVELRAQADASMPASNNIKGKN